MGPIKSLPLVERSMTEFKMGQRELGSWDAVQPVQCFRAQFQKCQKFIILFRNLWNYAEIGIGVHEIITHHPGLFRDLLVVTKITGLLRGPWVRGATVGGHWARGETIAGLWAQWRTEGGGLWVQGRTEGGPWVQGRTVGGPWVLGKIAGDPWVLGKIAGGPQVQERTVGGPWVQGRTDVVPTGLDPTVLTDGACDYQMA